MNAECAALNDAKSHAALKGTEWHHANRSGTLGAVASSDLEPGTTMALGTICIYPSLSQCHCKWMSYLQDETCMIHPIPFTVYGAPLGAVAAYTMLSTV